MHCSPLKRIRLRAKWREAAKTPGTFANTALLARRMVERGVRFVQIYHNNWDTHANVSGRLPDQCRDVDQPCYGLIQDLKQRGMLDDTLILWTTEFGRMPSSQGGKGRDHNPYCFTNWLCGGGIKGGQVVGSSDEIGAYPKDRPVTPGEVAATMMRSLKIDLDTELPSLQGCPIRVVEQGVNPISELF